MKKYLIIGFLIAQSFNSFGMDSDSLWQIMPKDTMIDNLVKEDSLIEEVIQSRTAPRKEKVQYFNQVTKYGFKNLFSNLSYNPGMPYVNQINPNAEIFVQDYVKAHGEHLTKMKVWGLPYFNLIENVLQQYGLPKELKYIAVIESNLSAGATSIVGAGGPWQFMPYTAREYGLVVSPYLDERRDYLKSSHAAARYLLKLYRDMHDWLLVMAAYNGGPGRVYNAIKKSGSKDFWKLQYHLPEESRTYVKRFIATHYIMEGVGGVTTMSNTSYSFSNENNSRTNYGTSSTKANPYNNTNTNTEVSEEVDVLSISGKYNSLVVAKNLSMDIAQFNHYNPDFDKHLAQIGTTELRLPNDKMNVFVANKYTILNESISVLLGSTNIPTTKTVYKKPASKRK